MSSLALETVDRYRELAHAQLRCARWEAAAGDPRALVSYDAALEAVEKPTVALPADGTVRGEDFNEILQPLVLLRLAIVDGVTEARTLQLPAPREAPEPDGPAAGDPQAYIRRLRWHSGAVLAVLAIACGTIVAAANAVATVGPGERWAVAGAYGGVIAAFAAVEILAFWRWRRAADFT